VLTYRGQALTGDAIHFAPHTRAYRIDNLHTALSRDFLQNRATSPLYLSGGSVTGRQDAPILASDVDATTCDKDKPDYLLRASRIRVDPGHAVTLGHVAFVVWGKRLFTLPTLVIPLDRPCAEERLFTPGRP